MGSAARPASAQSCPLISLIPLSARVRVLRQKCCWVGLQGSALEVAGDGRFCVIRALNSETYAVQAFSVKVIEPVLRATVPCTWRAVPF